MEVNRIKEIFSGHYQMILDFPSVNVLKEILDPKMKYVWVHDHGENMNEWVPYRHSLFDKKVSDLEMLVESRNLKMDFLVETADFFRLIPYISQSIKLYQIDEKPTHYLDLKRINGRRKYDMLKKEVDYLFEIEIPYPADYAPIVSPDKEFLQSILINNDIDDLP